MFRDRIQIGKEERGWEPVFRGKSLADFGHEGKWTLVGDTLSVDAIGEGAWLSIASDDLVDFELKAGITAVIGGNSSIFFRQINGCSYQFDLKCEWQAAIVRFYNHHDGSDNKIISAVNYELYPGQRYEVEIAVRGESITTYIERKLVNQVRDGRFAKGGICLTAWQSKAQFTNPCLRIYD